MIAREQINDFSLGLVAPLQADDTGGGHWNLMPYKNIRSNPKAKKPEPTEAQKLPADNTLLSKPYKYGAFLRFVKWQGVVAAFARTRLSSADVGGFEFVRRFLYHAR
jgi:hypothetical protein